jgi:IS30 family transposase
MGKTYKHLSLQERVVVQTQLELGLSPGAIAAGLKRDRSSISRELRRKSSSINKGCNYI